MDPIAQTSRWTAAARARESRRPDRLFDDPFAEKLAGPEGFALLDGLEQIGGENPFIVVRTFFLDTLLRDAVKEQGQVVFLAAGLDTRAYRCAWPAGVTWFELDRAAVLEEKARLLEGATPRCDRRAVPVDLASDWRGALEAAGFDRGRPAVWIVEGLLVYLDDAKARAILSAAATLAAPGSLIALDVPGTTLVTSPLLGRTLEKLARLGAPWQYATDDPEGLLRACGWAVTRVARPGEPDTTYGRWPYRAAPRGTPGVPETFFVVASR